MTTNQAWVEHALERMTVSEKIGQITQVSNDSITPAEVAGWTVGWQGGNGDPHAVPRRPIGHGLRPTATADVRSGDAFPTAFDNEGT